MYYAKARYYNPSIGRFISEDSYEGNINTLMSLNLYIYCHNTDLSGHKVKWNQWDNLIGAFIKTGWEITKGRMFPTDPVSGWKNFKAMKELFEGVISGEITLKDLADMGINAAIMVCFNCKR